MNREIKFRAWVGSEKRMERDMFYINQWDGKCHYTQPYHYEAEDDVKIYDCGEEEPTLMQYTGLKDKNGKEIFEGDIIKSWYSRDMSGEDIVTVINAVEFEENHDSTGFVIHFIENAEVIGNIFEHEKLLTDAKIK